MGAIARYCEASLSKGELPLGSDEVRTTHFMEWNGMGYEGK